LNANDKFCLTNDDESCLSIDFILVDYTNANPKREKEQGLIGLAPE